MFLRFLYGVFTVSLRSATNSYGYVRFGPGYLRFHDDPDRSVLRLATVELRLCYDSVRCPHGYLRLAYDCSTTMLRFPHAYRRCVMISWRSPQQPRPDPKSPPGPIYSPHLSAYYSQVKFCYFLMEDRSITSWTINLRRLIWIAMVVLFFYLM